MEIYLPIAGMAQNAIMLLALGIAATQSSAVYAQPPVWESQTGATLPGQALDNIDNPVEVDYYVCDVCGYTCENEAPDVCPVCGALAKAFFKSE